MANRTGDYLKQYRKDDPVTGIGYKIIYNKPRGKYEIYTQYPYNGKNLRNKIRTPEVIKREHDLEKLIDYVENTIIENHIRFFENGMFNKDLGTNADLDRGQTTEKANQLEPAIQPEETLPEINSVTETSIVYNKDYGKGVISKITDEKIYVKFGDNLRIFQYPDAFEKGYLSLN